MNVMESPESTHVSPARRNDGRSTLRGAANAVTERNAGLGAAIGVVTGVLVILAFLLINMFVKDDDVEL